MRLSKLYIEDFMCYSGAYIDFSQFSSILIVGKVENNEIYSNGVGKTTIFKAIEYVLFNQSDYPLERIIRDDTPWCKITFDFYIGDQEYRLSRKRTKKGSTDLTLWQRNSVPGTDEEVYHVVKADGIHIPKNDDEHKFWKDISGRRTADTEKELEKLIKTNFKSFRGIVHFMQNDFSGLTTATPEKRKALLKDIFNIIVYSKLEKIAKDRSSLLSKDIEKHKTIIESTGDVDSLLSELQIQFVNVNNDIGNQNLVLKDPMKQLELETENLNSEISLHKDLESKYSSLLIREKAILSEIGKNESTLKEYKDKKGSCIKLAKELIEENKVLQSTIAGLQSIDFSQIDVLLEQINNAKQKVVYNNVLLQNNISRYEELKIPVPDENLCKHCRQIMTEEHKKSCKVQIAQEISDCQKIIKNTKKEIGELNAEITVNQQKMTALSRSKQQLDELSNKVVTKDREIKDKKGLHEEYSVLVEKFNNELKDKNEELNQVRVDLKNSSLAEAEVHLVIIDAQREKIKLINNQIASINKELAHLNASKAVISHNIERNIKEKDKLLGLKKSLAELEEKHKMYPHVLQAFSSTGIPNLIIHNVLDDLQDKANELLGQLKPGMQLAFFVEKTKTDGSEADTLDIQYYVNGRERYYEQLSGAMKISAMFSLKLGLSHLLQQMFGTDIRFLLLDEIDQALDKASIDAFADIVRFFQNNYTMMIITHNDRLKEKKSIFSHAICVEQDINMISKAKVVSSW